MVVSKALSGELDTVRLQAFWARGGSRLAIYREISRPARGGGVVRGEAGSGWLGVARGGSGWLGVAGRAESERAESERAVVKF